MKERSTPGERIRALRKARPKLTQQEVADAIGISRQHLNMIELGKDLPGRETLSAIADFFSVSVDYILNGGEASPHTPSASEVVDDPDELAWLRLWRSWTRDERALALKMLRPPTS